jgi:hypothetical protein
VGDLVLHRRHRADPAAHQGGRGTREQVTYASNGTRTRVEHDQAGHRPGLTEQIDKPAGFHQIGAAILANQR